MQNLHSCTLHKAMLKCNRLTNVIFYAEAWQFAVFTIDFVCFTADGLQRANSKHQYINVCVGEV